jgi:hypothetical protein
MIGNHTADDNCCCLLLLLLLLLLLHAVGPQGPAAAHC